ncbi:hypothetical protein AKJ16_DCAP01421 [Drosera capensis]
MSSSDNYEDDVEGFEEDSRIDSGSMDEGIEEHNGGTRTEEGNTQDLNQNSNPSKAHGKSSGL